MNQTHPVSAEGVFRAPAVDLRAAVAEIARSVERSGGCVVAVCIDGATGLFDLASGAQRLAPQPAAIGTGLLDPRLPSTEHQP